MFDGIRFTNVQTDFVVSNSIMSGLAREKLDEMTDGDRHAVSGASFFISGSVSAVSELPLPDEVKRHFSYIQSFSYMKMGEGYFTRRRNYDSYLLLLTYSGKGELHYRGESYTLLPGSLFVIDCREEHEYRTLGNSWEHSDLHIRGGNTEYLYTDYFSKHSPVYLLSNWKEYQHRLEKLLKANQELALYRNFNVSVELEKLLLYILSGQNGGNSTEKIPVYISSLTEFLAQNYSGEISLEDMSAQCGLSKYHFLRTFKQYTGFTPYDYLNTLRITQAKNLLTDTDIPAYKIGQLVGFSGEAAFIRQFKLKTGLTPGAYRDNQRLE